IISIGTPSRPSALFTRQTGKVETQSTPSCLRMRTMPVATSMVMDVVSPLRGAETAAPRAGALKRAPVALAIGGWASVPVRPPCPGGDATRNGAPCRRSKATWGKRMRLEGKVALLTGAAAAIKGELMGFGGAAAHLFAREGAKVVLTDIRDQLGER